MPKTASKRARARRAARVTRAHQTVLEQPVVRRPPRATTRRRRKTGLAGFFDRYPLATIIFAVALVGGVTGLMYANHLGPWTPQPKKAAAAPSCNLKTHVCQQPNMTISMNKLYVATIHTAKGDIVIDMNPNNAPKTVNNFVYLAKQGFYNGLTFWRVDHKGQPSVLSNGQPSSLDVIQGGDPTGKGTGGPGYSLPTEKVVGQYTAGCVAMASGQDPNTNAYIPSGSQFFICTGDDSSALSNSYNLFGQVASGLDVAQKITPGDKMLSVTIAEKALPKPTPTTAAPTATPATPAPTATSAAPTATPTK